MSSKNDLECIRADFSDIDDKTVIKYFEIALDDIRNIEVSDERKKSRAKRLGLSKDFNRWNQISIKRMLTMKLILMNQNKKYCQQKWMRVNGLKVEVFQPRLEPINYNKTMI